jgi:HlyD family secretion protein
MFGLIRRAPQAPTDLEVLSPADRIERTPLAQGMPITLYLLFGTLIAFALWAGLSRIDEVVSARGKVVSVQSQVILQPTEPAQVAAIDASVGQTVRKGDVLVTFDQTNVDADLGQVRDRLRSLDAQVRRLEAEREGRPFQVKGGEDDLAQRQLELQRAANHKARMARFDESIARMKKSIELNASEIRSLEARLASLSEIEKMNEDLVNKQFQSRRSLLDSRERRLEAERDMASARSRANDIQREISALEADRAAYLAEQRQRIFEELVPARRERDALQQQLIKADRRSTMTTLVAPIDGVVLEVARVTRGSVVREGQPLVTLVPSDSPIEAEVRIDNADVSNVKVGDPVRVKIDAFPFQRFGVLPGRVRTLSPDTPQDSTPQNPQVPGQYVARVEVLIHEAESAERFGRLVPGMTLTGEIITGERSILSYLTEPVVRLQDEALRER